jgi:hypothetical protein
MPVKVKSESTLRAGIGKKQGDFPPQTIQNQIGTECFTFSTVVKKVTRT